MVQRVRMYKLDKLIFYCTYSWDLRCAACNDIACWRAWSNSPDDIPTLEGLYLDCLTRLPVTYLPV